MAFSSCFSKGYAEIAVRAAIERTLENAPHPEHGIVLHATPPGQSIYKRMGFNEISRIETYV